MPNAKARPARRYVERMLAAGQDVQLHLHPVWLTFKDGRPDLANQVPF